MKEKWLEIVTATKRTGFQWLTPLLFYATFMLIKYRPHKIEVSMFVAGANRIYYGLKLFCFNRG
jgi:hypothetical protein